MDYRIDDSHQHYIKVAVTGTLEKDTLLKAIRSLITHPDYGQKNSLWDLTKASQGSIGIWDIKEIVGFLRLYRPKEKSFANKGAFLVSNDIHKALINIYVTLSKLLPFKYKVCTDSADAKAFLTGTD